jgi:hypothetical protein
MGASFTEVDKLGKPYLGAKKPKEKWSGRERATFWSGIAGIVGVIGALVFSALQVQKSSDAIELTNKQLELTNEQLFEAKYESVYGHQLDLWQLTVQTPDVAPYIIGGQMPSGSGPARARVDAALANSLDFYAYVFQQLAPRGEDGNLPSQVLGVHEGDPAPPGIDSETWEKWWSWAPTILNGFDIAPGMCDQLMRVVPSSGFVYDGEFVGAVNDAGRC